MSKNVRVGWKGDAIQAHGQPAAAPATGQAAVTFDADHAVYQHEDHLAAGIVTYRPNGFYDEHETALVIGVVLAGSVVHLIERTAAAPMGRDQNGRYEHPDTYRLTAHRPTRHRT